MYSFDSLHARHSLESGALYSFCVIAYLVSGAILSPPAVRPNLKHPIAFDHIHDSVRQIIINNILTGALPQVVVSFHPRVGCESFLTKPGGART
jgi:hypothetical protein